MEQIQSSKEAAPLRLVSVNVDESRAEPRRTQPPHCPEQQFIPA